MSKVPETSSTEDTSDEVREEQNRLVDPKLARRQDWDAIDCSGQGMKSISPALYLNFSFLKELYLDHNRLQFLDPMIGQLRCLEKLDVSGNLILNIPEEIGMLVDLQHFLAYDNNITDLPREIGHLHRLEVLGLEGNPLDDDIRERLATHGTKALITDIREGMTGKSKFTCKFMRGL